MGLSFNSSPKSSNSTLYSSLNNSPSSSVGTHLKAKPKLYPVTIQWKGQANSIFITGSFFKWKVNVPLIKGANDTYEITLVSIDTYSI